MKQKMHKELIEDVLNDMNDLLDGLSQTRTFAVNEDLAECEEFLERLILLRDLLEKTECSVTELIHVVEDGIEDETV